MFKPNPDGMRMEPTPERVLAVCRLAARGGMTREEIREAMTLGTVNERAADQINKSINVALDELGLLQPKDQILCLAVPPEIVFSPQAFRRYVSAQVFSRKDSTFVMLSKWVIGQNEKLLDMGTWEVMAKTCASQESLLSRLNENAVLGWRFWAAFLGLGYLSGTMLLPNMKQRLEDVLAEGFRHSFKCEEAVLAADFIAWLRSRLPETELGSPLPLAVSSGLRTLHELGLIKLETWRDSDRVMLYYVDGDPINAFSHITVSEEGCR